MGVGANSDGGVAHTGVAGASSPGVLSGRADAQAGPERVGEVRREGPPADSALERVRPTQRMCGIYLPGLAGPEAARGGQWAA